jgi:replicative DNA helicase
MTNHIEQSTPQNEEAEAALLSCIMQSDEQAVPDILHKVIDAHFHNPKFKTVFCAALTSYASSKKCGIVDILAVLSKEEMKLIGGRAGLADIYRACPTGAEWKKWHEVLEDMRYRRSLVDVAREMIVSARDRKRSVVELKAEAETKVLGLDVSVAQEDSASLKHAAMNAIKHFEDIYTNGIKGQGLMTGWPDLDRKLLGLRKSEMTIIAARPSVGKSAAMMQWAEKFGITDGLRGLIFSAEMSTDNLIQRQVCSMSRVSINDLAEKKVAQQGIQRMSEAAAKIATSNLHINDTSAPSIAYIASVARRIHRMTPLDFMMFDYLQLGRGMSRRSQDNRQLEIAEISAGLKGIAKELKIPVIVLAQLNRKPEDRAGGRPRLSDLKESGSLEQDADVVILMSRDEEAEANSDTQQVVTFDVAKQRNGATGDFQMMFLKSATRFEPILWTKEQ